MLKINRQEINLLYAELKKVNLVQFMEKELGTAFSKAGEKYTCLCPMPNHKDSQPSFNTYKSSDEDGGECWVYHCFGCGSGGTIIDFCMNYWSLEHPYDAIVFLVEKLNIKDTYEIIVNAIKEAKIEVNLRKRIDGEHFMASKRCYGLLKRYDNPEVKDWVYNCYRQMNEALGNNDIKLLNKISDAIVKKESELHGVGRNGG